MTQHVPERRGEGSLDISSYDEANDDKHSNVSDNSAKEDLKRYIREQEARTVRRVSPRKAAMNRRVQSPSVSSQDNNEMTYQGNLVNYNTVPV